MNPAFAQLLSQLLYSQTELRPAILKALKVIIESNQPPTPPLDADGLRKQLIDDVTPEEKAANIVFLKAQVESWLAVLFNVFGSVSRDSRGMVADVISAWASIADEPVTSILLSYLMPRCSPTPFLLGHHRRL